MPKTKTKTHCDVCGRILRGLHIPIDSPEQALCSFCEVEIRRQVRAEKEAERRLLNKLKPCVVCGKMAVLDMHTKKCPDCYFKGKFPAVTKVTELSRFDFEKHRKVKTRMPKRKEACLNDCV